MKQIKRMAVIALALSCSACTVGEYNDEDVPDGWKAFVAPGNVVTYVAPAVMADGTKCVVVFGNSAGRGVSCDWENAE